MQQSGSEMKTSRFAVFSVVAVLSGVLSGTLTSESSAAPFDSSGSWGPVADWPLVAIHAVLSPDGEVLTYGTNADTRQTGRFIYDVWTPGESAAAGHSTLANTTQTDLFCSVQINRYDNGETMLFGGDNYVGTRTTNRGNPDIDAFDPRTNTLRELPAMNRSRWYASATTMPDGSFYIQGGLDGEDRAERWSPTAAIRHV